MALKRHIPGDTFISSRRLETDEFRITALPYDWRVPEERAIMALLITRGEVDGLTVLWLDGRIVLGEETGALRETVKDLIAHGQKKLILNMNNVTLIDSAGLGALVAAYSSSRSGGASLRICQLGTKFNELLQITRLTTLFEIYDTQADAIDSFSK
jgi:anti-sigma B factor antagonist